VKLKISLKLKLLLTQGTLCFLMYYSKGKAIPLQAWTGPEVSRKLRLPHFKKIGTWRW